MIQFIGGVFSFMKHDDFAKKEVSLYAPDIYLFKPSRLFFPVLITHCLILLSQVSYHLWRWSLPARE